MMRAASAGYAGVEYLAAEDRAFSFFGLRPQKRDLSLPPLLPTLSTLATGDGEPVVLLHGITLIAAFWAPLLSELPGLRAIALDMPGHGGSAPVDYLAVDLRDWHVGMLTRCLDALGLRSAHVVGHSHGGMIGLWLALDAPERVRSLVVLGTPAVALGARPDALLRMLALPTVGRLMLSLPSSLPAYRRFVELSLGSRAVAGLGEDLLRAVYLGSRRPGFARTVSSYLREQFHGPKARREHYVLSLNELERVTAAVLVLWGEEDRRYQPIGEAQQLVAHLRNARFEIVPGGHAPWLDDPRGCAVRMRHFWDSNAPRAVNG